MKSLRLVLLLTAFVLGSAAVLHGQTKPIPHTSERITLSFAVSANVDCYFQFGHPSGSPLYTSYLGHSGIGTWNKNAPLGFDVDVGVTYQILLAAAQADWDQTDVRINAPPGYKLYIAAPSAGQLKQRTSYVATPTVGVTNEHYANFILLPDDGDQRLAVGQMSAPQVAGNLSWAVGLGINSFGQAMGSLRMNIGAVGSGVFDASILGYESFTGDVTVTSVGGSLRQVFSPQVFADIHPITQLGALPGFLIDLYGPDAFAGPPDGDGVYAPVGSPAVSIAVQNDHDYSAGVDRLLLTRTEGSRTQIWRIVQTGTTAKTWTVSELDLGRVTSYTSTILGNGDRQEDVVLKDAANVTALKTRRVYRLFASGTVEELVQEVADPDNTALTTTYDYYYGGGDAGTGNWGRLKSVTRPDGAWTKYEYYGDGTSGEYGRFGQLKSVSAPWQDAPSAAGSATTGNCHYILYDYAGERSVFQESLASVETRISGTTVAQTTYGPSFGASANSQPLRSDMVRTYTGSGTYLTTARKSYHETADPKYAGRLYSQVNPDGSKVSRYHIFDSGGATEVTVSGWSTSVSGSTSVTSVDGHVIEQIYLVPNRSTRRIDTLTVGSTSYSGSETQIYTSSGTWETIAHTSTRYDGAYKIYTTDVLRSSVDNVRVWTDGAPSLDTANDGTITGYSVDERGRMLWRRKYSVPAAGSYPTQDWLYTHFRYDAASHVVWQRVNNSSNPNDPGPTATSEYDYAGRLVNSTDADGLTTHWDYANGGRIVTVTLPGGATRITENYLDGSPKLIGGTSVVGGYHATTVDSGGTLSATIYTLRASDVSAPTSAPRWAQTTTDWAGRKISEERPAPGGTFTRSSFYDSAGRLHRVTEPGLADTLTDYNDYGEAYRTGLDLDASGTLVAASGDRLTDTNVAFAYQDGAWWRVTTTLGYNQAGSGAAYTSSLARERLTGFSGTLQQESYAVDLFGNQTHHTLTVDSSTGLTTDTTDVPDSATNIVAVTRYGWLQTNQSAQGLVAWTYYDSLGRVTKKTDPRTDTGTAARIAYASNSYRVVSREDTAGNQTCYTYDSAGRVASTTNPLGRVAYQSYNTRDQMTRTWGQTSYPVEYGFDDYGQQTTMSTFRGGTGWDGASWPGSPGTADTTTWAYDNATGTLTSKTDAASHAVNYTYNVRGQLATRTWGRGTVTTYSYSSTTAEQTGISYSDSTPAITYTYNRLGQSATVADVTGTRTFAYSTTTTALDSETFPSYFDSRVLTRKYDTSTTGALGRNTGYTLSGASGAGTDNDVSYGYDSSARFNGVSIPSGPAFTYSFTSNSNLVASIAETSGWTETNTYEAHRNLLTQIKGQFSTPVKAQFDYAHDALGRRASVVDSGEIFARYVNGGIATHYGYNDRSEVISAQSYHGTSATDLSYPVAARGFTYAFDNIGSRTSSSVIGTDEGDVHTTTYANNALNQVTTRSGPGSVEVYGQAPSGATITVNSLATTRQGDLFYKNVTAGSTPAWLGASVANSLGGSGTRYSFVPPASETHTYDDDGNLTADGRWSYVWDAENRLVAMETVSGAYTVGVPRQLIQFKYDYLGRRVRKTVSNWNGSAYVATLDRKFLYNGWNLIGEYDVGTSSLSLVTSYAWGLDLSGNLVDGGGVGGLLAIRDVANSAWHLPYYDANGNLHALVDRASGTLTAAYEYSPFGETLRSTGNYATTNSFRFSTKYTDAETQLIYYGYRYYNPSLGRWLGRDRMEEKGGIHLYAFCRNNPINSWDILGNLDIDEFWAYTQGIGTSSNWTSSDWSQYTQWQDGLLTDQWEATFNGLDPHNQAPPETLVPTISYSDGIAAFGNQHISGGETIDYNPSTGRIVNVNGLRVLPRTNVTILPAYSIEGGSENTTSASNSQDQTVNGAAVNGSGVSSPNSLASYQALAAKIGWNGFSTNLSEYQQRYYGAALAKILQMQAEGKDVSRLYAAVIGEVPGVITDNQGLPAGNDADAARARWIIGAGAAGTVVASNVVDTLARISRGEIFPHRNDGAVFQNREGLLPEQSSGYYREYVNPTPGSPGPGAQRIVIGQGGEVYYTPDHYRTFVRVPTSGAGGEKQPMLPGGG